MKPLLSILLMMFAVKGYGQKDSSIHQEVFFSFGTYHLVTNDGSLYDNVVHGSLEFVEAQKQIELNKALARRKTIAIVTAKCKK